MTRRSSLLVLIPVLLLSAAALAADDIKLVVNGKTRYVIALRKDGGFYWVKATVIPNIRNRQVVGYTSVRRKPSRQKIAECMALYPTLF